MGKSICYFTISFPCFPCRLLASSKEGRCGITSCEAMEDWEGQGFLPTKIFIHSIDVMICEVLTLPKCNPDVHIFTKGDQLMKLANENDNYICVNSVHEAAGITIVKSIQQVNQ